MKMLKLTGLREWRQRNDLTIAISIIVLAFMLVLFLQAQAINKLQQTIKTQGETTQEVKNVADQLNANAKQRTAQINALTKHLDCMFLFFGTGNPDRTNKAIQDINTCTIEGINGTSPSTQTLAPSSSATPAPKSTTNTPAPTRTPTTKVDPPQSFLGREVVSPIKRLLNAL